MSVVVESTNIFRRVVEPEKGTFSPELARYVLGLTFGEADHVRYQRLMARAQEGQLTEQETAELDGFLQVDSLLAILRLKAQRSLAR